jgi:phage terminase large subunit GpA-like protein
LSDWADRHFVLPAGDANAGRWRTLPYQRGILDAISDPGIERVTVMKSSRVGYTKSFCAAIGYFIAHDPCPILVVQPTIEDAKKHSKEDLAPMLAEVPALRGLVAEAKTRDPDNTILEKRFRGGSLSLIGANSPRGFRRTSRRVVIFDEVDGYPASAGAEGDPLELGIRRTEYYWNRKILAGSTPTLAGLSRIETLFAEGDQRRYYVPCPHCGAYQVLRWANLRWPEGRPQAAVFVCESQGCTIEPRTKRDLVEAGEWRAEARDHFTPEHRHASFHIWAAYSYSPNASWGQLAAEFERATAHQMTHQTFVNTVRGEVWQEATVAAHWETLFRRREAYRIGTAPAGVRLVTIGVDVQKDRLVYEVVGWGRGKTSWSIEAGILVGETADLERGPWPQLDALLARPIPHERGSLLTAAMLSIDTGYNTSQVYAWARRYPVTRVVPVRGHGGIAGLVVGPPRALEVSRGGKVLKRGWRAWPVYGRVAKDELFGFFRLEVPVEGGAPPPGYCHFPEYDAEVFKQLTAEQLVWSRATRRYEYVQIEGRANDWLDARIYARAAACLTGLDRFTEPDWVGLERQLGIEPPPRPAPPAPATSGPAPTAAPVPPVRRPTPWLTPRRGWLR